MFRTQKKSNFLAPLKNSKSLKWFKLLALRISMTATTIEKIDEFEVLVCKL